MCDKEVVNLHENPWSLAVRMLKVLLQQAEEVYPALKKNIVSVLCIIGIILSCSPMIAIAGVFDIVVPRQKIS
jgi:hypothetical protein